MPFVPAKLRSSLSQGSVCADAVHPSLGGRKHLAVHNHYGTQHALTFIRQQESSSSGRLLYLNRASALGNLGKAGHSGDELTADWISMKMALVQVKTHLSSFIAEHLFRLLRQIPCHADANYQLLSTGSAGWSNVGFSSPDSAIRNSRFICFQFYE